VRKGKVYNYHRAREIRQEFKKFLLEYVEEFYEFDFIDDSAFLINNREMMISFDSAKVIFSKRIDKSGFGVGYMVVDEKFSIVKLRNFLKKKSKIAA